MRHPGGSRLQGGADIGVAVEALPHQGEEQGTGVDVPAVCIHAADRPVQTGFRPDQRTAHGGEQVPYCDGFHLPLNSFPPGLQRGLHDGLAQVGIADTNRRRLLGHQAGRSHAGQRVDFKEIGGPVLGHDEVGPGIDGQADGAEHGQGRLSHCLLPLRWNLCGTHLPGGTGLVLVGVVIEVRLGDDLNGGQRPAVEHCHLDLTPLDVLLQDRASAQTDALLQAPAQLLPGVGDGHADGGAAGNGLYHRGKGGLLRQDVQIGPL